MAIERRVGRMATAAIAAVASLGACRGDPADRAPIRREPAPAASTAEPGGGMSREAYDRWRRPEVVIEALDLAAGQRVADVGAGTGYFTLRLAEAVGPGGRVVATDVDPRALEALEELARGTPGDAAAPRAAIEARRVAPDDPGLEPGGYDRVLVAQVDHLVPDRAAYLGRLRAALAPGGRIVVSNRLQHRAGLLRAAAEAGYAVTAAEGELPGQFVAILVPEQPGRPALDPR